MIEHDELAGEAARPLGELVQARALLAQQSGEIAYLGGLTEGLLRRLGELDDTIASSRRHAASLLTKVRVMAARAGVQLDFPDPEGVEHAIAYHSPGSGGR